MNEFKPPAEFRSSGLKAHVAKADTTEAEKWIASDDNTPLFYKHPMPDMVLDKPPKNVLPQAQQREHGVTLFCGLCEGFLTEDEGYVCYNYDEYCFDCWDKIKP